MVGVTGESAVGHFYSRKWSRWGSVTPSETHGGQGPSSGAHQRVSQGTESSFDGEPPASGPVRGPEVGSAWVGIGVTDTYD